MRSDTRNLLDKLGKSDFEYREFDGPAAESGYSWLLLDLVYRVLTEPAPAVVPSVAPKPVERETPPPAAPLDLAPPSAIFASYGASAPRAPAAAPSVSAPAAGQDLGALLSSYSGRR